MLVERAELPPGAVVRPLVWVLKIKNGDVSARPCADGSRLKPGVDFDPAKTSTANASAAAAKTFLAQAAHHRQRVSFRDVRAAYAQSPRNPGCTCVRPGPSCPSTIYHSIHDGVLEQPGTWYLATLHNVNGEPTAGRGWEDHHRAVAQEMGWRPMTADLALLVYNPPTAPWPVQPVEQPAGQHEPAPDAPNRLADPAAPAMVQYVDDIAFRTPDTPEGRKCVDAYEQRFPCSKPSNPDEAMFLGVKIHQNIEGHPGEIQVSQTHVIDALANKVLAEPWKGQAPKTPVPIGPWPTLQPRGAAELTSEQKNHQAAVGALNQLVIWTRPDARHAVSRLQATASNPQPIDFLNLRRLVEYLRSTRQERLRFKPPPAAADKMKLEVFTDASLDTTSTAGTMVKINGTTIIAKCKRIAPAPRSAMEAELAAMSDGLRQGQGIRQILVEAGDLDQHEPVVIKADNAAACAHARGFTTNGANRHFVIQIRPLQEALWNSSCVIEQVSSADQEADILTKPLREPRVRFLTDKLLGHSS